MNRKSLIITVCLLFVTIFFIIGSVNGAEPGSTTDPLVSRSYVDQRINEVLSAFGQTTPSTSINNPSINSESSLSSEELMLQIDFLIGERMKAAGSSVETPSYIPVSVQAGDTLFGGEGTEIILRRGKGTAVTSTDGIVDATSGLELYNGNSVTINHLLIVPREDGRGIKVSESAWFLVKGGYTIN